MPNRSADALFQLVKSLEKSEKRNFKLFVKRNSSGTDLKIIQLFDALDKMNDYDERTLLKKAKQISKQQLSNTKAHLYKQVLASLRLLKDEDNIDIQLHEQMDHARILYNKGLYLQSLRMLEKLKDVARIYHQLTYLQQALFFEKKIETLYITRSIQDRALQLSAESDAVNNELMLVSRLSNLALQLYSWYIRHGHARNEEDLRNVRTFFESNLPPEAGKANAFYELLYLYQSQVWYAFIRQDFLHFYRYAQKWVDLFNKYPGLLKAETANYIKGMHNLMQAQFNLGSHQRLAGSMREFEQFMKQKFISQNENNRILAYQYLYNARINLYFSGEHFQKG